MEVLSKTPLFGFPHRAEPGLGAEELVRLIARLGKCVLGAAGHSRRVARYAAETAEGLGLRGEEVVRLRLAGAVHDIGKIETPLRIVNKPGPLSEEEFAVLELHAATGARMVAGLVGERLAAMVRHHHERFDGRGYPDGLVADQIPLGARVVAVADTFDAITSSRPYRLAKQHREALELLGAEAGKQLDPDVVRAFRHRYARVISPEAPAPLGP
jgi:HD-GYP domain-containing protein (c-di-GMP phosphodiesterase class II)